MAIGGFTISVQSREPREWGWPCGGLCLPDGRWALIPFDRAAIESQLCGELEHPLTTRQVRGDLEDPSVRVVVMQNVLAQIDSLDDLKARVRAREKEFVVETLWQIAKGELRLVKGAG